MAPTEQSHATTLDFEVACAVLACVVCLTLTMGGGYWLRRRHVFVVPESVVGLALGALAAGLLRLRAPSATVTLSAPAFYFGCLPPIILNAGFALERAHFFDNLGAISLLAVLGTLVSTFVVGALVKLGAARGLFRLAEASLLDALLFGALISAVDPVATLAIVGHPELKADPLLYALSSSAPLSAPSGMKLSPPAPLLSQVHSRLRRERAE